MVFYYLVTIKNNSHQYTSLWDLTDALVHVRRLHKTSDWSCVVKYELDSLNRLHLHTVMQCTKRPYFKRIIDSLKRKFPTYSVDFREFPLEDGNKVYRYITKEPRSRFELEQDSLIHFMNRRGEAFI